eukprot:SAG11_NODE_853_length_6874_cov_1.980074_4_plen_80_part_00
MHCFTLNSTKVVLLGRGSLLIIPYAILYWRIDKFSLDEAPRHGKALLPVFDLLLDVLHLDTAGGNGRCALFQMRCSKAS